MSPSRWSRRCGGRLPEIGLRQLDADALRADAAPHMEALAQWYGSQRASLWTSAPDIRAETFLLAPEVGLKGRLDIYMRGVGGDSLLELKTGQARTQLPKREHRLAGLRLPDTADRAPATRRRKPAARRCSTVARRGRPRDTRYPSPRVTCAVYWRSCATSLP